PHRQPSRGPHSRFRQRQAAGSRCRDLAPERLAPASPGAYVWLMPLSKAIMLAMATALVLVALDAAIARTRRPAARSSAEAAFWGGLIPKDPGVPVIMKGYHPPKVTTENPLPERRTDKLDKPIRIPRGSSTYIPPPVPSPNSPNSPPARALTQPT